MEPVPETERMEEFRSSPLPTLRLHQPTAIAPNDLDQNRKPPNPRRSTEPYSPSQQSWPITASIPYRPRTTSPLSGAHTRSKSAASLAPPSMGRTRSMPGVDGAGRILYPPLVRPASPSGSPSRHRAPRKPVDEAFPPTSPVRSSVLDGEKRLAERSSSPGPGLPSASNASHRRASSPLRYTAYSTPTSIYSIPGSPSTVASSPSYRYESSTSSYSFPSYHLSSSIPSTPSSVRSRSPSISSLETIPDTPDAEEAALEAENIAQLKAAADAADGGDLKGRGSLDVPVRGRTLGVGSRDKRKRWSVCGAERRGDLDLETIWED
ncbi:Uu.00g045730.m01.CDS01 [Anthostomella pinea]|uniref:Uu.00g045730.m01.CDS01 n=1 Tax=Anthostomella pinea TaxID=933095 RepID=A0AAI8YEF1_9PEZI|nr:Uu.00g045730.m01.CDS01 [Anthostomella pinea]